MKKVVEIDTCVICPYFSGMDIMCIAGKVDKDLAGFNIAQSIPFWCPLPDKKERKCRCKK